MYNVITKKYLNGDIKSTRIFGSFFYYSKYCSVKPEKRKYGRNWFYPKTSDDYRYESSNRIVEVLWWIVRIGVLIAIVNAFI